MIIRILFLFLFLSCSSDSYTWFHGTLDEAILSMDSNSKKLVLLDFYSDGWGACVRLDAETLSNPKVIEFSNSNLISIKLNPWENPAHSKLLDQYMGQAIPLLIFINNQGEEVDRMLGFYPPDEYLSMITNIYNGIDTYLSLKRQYQSGENTPSTLSKLSKKCKLSPDPEFCLEVYKDIVSLRDGFDNHVLFDADLFFARRSLDKGDTNLILQLIENHKGGEYTSDAYFSIINYYRLKNESNNESYIFKKFSDTFSDNPSILNQYAWRMTELGVNLNDALNKSNKAIELSFDNASLQTYIIDTKAEILWMLGRVDEAIVAIDLAIDINSNDEYLIEQRDKFLNSTNKSSKNDN